MKCTSAPHSTRWRVSGWRIYFLEVFFTHVCAALVFLGSSHPQGIASPRASPHDLDVSQRGNFMVDTLLWQLSPKRQEVEVSRPAKGYAQMNISHFHCILFVKTVTGPTQIQRGRHSTSWWNRAKPHCKRVCGISNCPGHLCQRPELWFSESYSSVFPNIPYFSMCIKCKWYTYTHLSTTQVLYAQLHAAFE